MRRTTSDGHSRGVEWSAPARLVLGCLLLGLSAAACGEDRRPGVVLIVVDTLRGDVATDPDGRFATPNLDAFAREGILFENAFSHAPMTLPAHTSLFSGRPPFETGILVNGQDVRPELPLLAEWMAGFGYSPYAVLSLGTLHFVADSTFPEKRGLSRGFITYDEDFWHIDQAPRVMSRLTSTLNAIDPEEPFLLFAHFCDPHEPYNAHGTQKRSAQLLLDGSPFEEVSIADMTLEEREVELEAGRHVFEARSPHLLRFRGFQAFRGDERLEVEWVEGELAEPTRAVRIAFEVPEAGGYTLRYWLNDALNRRESVARYAEEVGFVDRHLGELFEELRARGLYEDHWVVFTSDHGEALGERGYLGHVENLHDELIHVPLIIKPPRGAPQRAALEAGRGRLVSHSDLAATLLDVLGLPALPGQRGTSLLAERQPLLIAETHRPEAKRNLICFRDERFKLIFDPDAESFEMYDLEADPGEENDVFASRGDERPEWPERLREIARRAAAGPARAGADAETLEDLKALGYGGGE